MKSYYVWAESMCDNVTESFGEALQWMTEFVAEGKEDVYIADENNNVVFD